MSRKEPGQVCGQRDPADPSGHCPGTIHRVGSTVSSSLLLYRFLACDACDWTLRQRMPEPPTEPLFDRDEYKKKAVDET